MSGRYRSGIGNKPQCLQFRPERGGNRLAYVMAGVVPVTDMLRAQHDDFNGRVGQRKLKGGGAQRHRVLGAQGLYRAYPRNPCRGCSGVIEQRRCAGGLSLIHI